MLANIPRPGRSFAGLRRYLVEGHLGAARDCSRVTWIRARNLVSDDPALATRIMTATARLSARVERPVYHLIVSWHADEMPSTDAMLNVAETTLADIGLADHQALVIGHGDTGNPHLHMVVNRVHPETGVAWSTSHDYSTVERSMRRQAEANGFRVVRGRHNDPDATPDVVPGISAGEFQLLRKNGRKAIPQWNAKDSKALGQALKPVFERAVSWDEIDASLEAVGGMLVAKGQGLVVTNAQRSGYAKLSALGIGARLEDLEKRFGTTWKQHHPSRQTDEQPRTARSVLAMSEIDRTLALDRLGFIDRKSLTAANDAPVLAEQRRLRQAIEALIEPDDPEPDPTR